MRFLADETTLDKRSGQLSWPVSWITGPAKFLWVAGYLDVAGRLLACSQVLWTGPLAPSKLVTLLMCNLVETLIGTL